MENKQTAVDFIFSQLPDEYKTTRQGFEVYTQAKEMEKEQQKYFFDCGRQYQLTGEGTFKEVWDETYGGNK